MDFNQRHLSPALGAQWTFAFCKLLILKDWSGRMDLNHRPPGPEPGALARLRYAPNVYSKLPYSLRGFASRCNRYPQKREKTAGKLLLPGGSLKVVKWS